MHMKLLIFIFLILFGRDINAQSKDSIPFFIKGVYKDDYGSEYHIDNAVWKQLPNSLYNIVKVNKVYNFIIAKNDMGNKTDGGLFTRIDFVQLKNMYPYTWAFCLSEYNAKTDSAAEYGYKANRDNLMKGCNGFPFSRMKSAQ